MISTFQSSPFYNSQKQNQDGPGADGLSAASDATCDAIGGTAVGSLPAGAQHTRDRPAAGTTRQPPVPTPPAKGRMLFRSSSLKRSMAPRKKSLGSSVAFSLPLRMSSTPPRIQRRWTTS